MTSSRSSLAVVATRPADTPLRSRHVDRSNGIVREPGFFHVSPVCLTRIVAEHDHARKRTVEVTLNEPGQVSCCYARRHAG